MPAGLADAGRWKPVNPERQHRGHRLAAIAALAAEVTIRRGEEESSGGTEDLGEPACTSA